MGDTVPQLPTEDEIKAIEDAEALEARRTELTDMAEELANSESISDDDLATIEAIGDVIETIDRELEARAVAAAERQERLDNALGKIRGPADGDTEEDVDVDADATVDDGDTEEDDVVVPIDGETDDGGDDGEPTSVAAAATGGARTKPRLPKLRTAAELTKHRPNRAKPKERSHDFMRATAFASKRRAGDVLTDVMDVAKAITDTKLAWTRSGNVGRGSVDYVTIASGVKEDFAAELGPDPSENFNVLQDVRSLVTRDRDLSNGLVAAGGICAPLTPLYDFFRTAVRQTPVEDSLPTAQAPRGGIRFIVPPSYTQAASAVGTFDNREEDPADKPCLHVDCPSVDEEYVTAVTQCVEFDNLQYRVFSELVAAFMQDVAVIFDQTKEVRYIDFVHAASTAVTNDYGYGASKSLLYDWTVAAVRYRKRAQMPRNAMLPLWTYDWVPDLIKIDMANHGFGGLDWYNITDAQVEAFLRSRGLDPVWMNDSATGLEDQRLRGAQGAGALLDLPSTVEWYLHAAGTFVRLDAGTFDAGLVRDSNLNKQNNLQLFFEEWNGMAMLGQEAIRGASVACPNGAAAGQIDPIAC